MIFKKFIRKFRKEDWPALKDFLAEYFHDNYILLNKKFFYWQYRSVYSINASPSPATLVLVANNKLLGYLGLVPLKMNYFGNGIECACLANLMTHQSLRNKGVGVDFIEKAGEGYGLLYTLGYNQIMSGLYKRLSWESDILLKRFVLIINREKMLELVGRRTGFALYKSGHDGESSGLSFVKCFKIDDRIDAFWEKIKYKYPITVSRSKEYFCWRYENHPVFKYDIFCAEKDGKIKSVIVIRIENLNKYKIARIVDFVSHDDAEEFTLKKLTELCVSLGVDLIDFFFTGKYHTASLKKSGFREAMKPPLSLIPILFNPIDRKVKPINFAFKLTRMNFCDKRIYNINNWYITKGDGDQDRPNPR